MLQAALRRAARRPTAVRAVGRALSARADAPNIYCDPHKFDYLREILNARVYDVAVETPLQRANSLRVELANSWLSAQGCSSSEALLKLERLGFAVNAPTATATNAPPPCILSNKYGCDIALSKPVGKRSVPAAGNLCRWRWSGNQFCPTSWCAACASNPVCRSQCTLGDRYGEDSAPFVR